MASEFFGRQRECRFYTAGCGNKMAVSVPGPRTVNELGGPVIPGRLSHEFFDRKPGCTGVQGTPWDGTFSMLSILKI